jgi:N-dimethylarginine dimethylaminohydrolase
MEGNIGSTSIGTVAQQWSELRNVLVYLGADVVVLPKTPDYCPDAVFTANAGLVYGDSFIPSKFKHEERAVEEPFFDSWYRERGYKVDETASRLQRERYSFEGAGDALFNVDRSTLWYGFGFRSTFSYKAILDEFFDKTNAIVRPLELVDERFYHLDTCFCPLDTGELLWYPPAFSEHSQMVISSWYEGKSIEVSVNDARRFACNAVSIGDSVVVPQITPWLKQKLSSRGYSVYEVDMSQFLMGGGACKCLTLEAVE